MAKNEQSREANQPIWFDGKSINEALFCDDFLSRHKIIYTNGAFFTPDGRVTDDLPLRSEIFDELRCCAVSNNIGSPANQFIYLAENDLDLSICKQWRELEIMLRELQICLGSGAALILSLAEAAPFTAQEVPVTGKSQICGGL